MDQSYLSFLHVVSQKMASHFYVLGLGMEHWVLCNAYGTCAITLKWDMGILLTNVTHGICDPKELRATTSCGNALCLGSGLSNTVCGKTKTPKKIPRTGKSQKWTSYLTDTQQNPHLKNHEEPKKKTQSAKGRCQECDAVREYALDCLPMRSPW
jgi:hypothetical protein